MTGAPQRDEAYVRYLEQVVTSMSASIASLENEVVMLKQHVDAPPLEITSTSSVVDSTATQGGTSDPSLPDVDSHYEDLLPDATDEGVTVHQSVHPVDEPRAWPVPKRDFPVKGDLPLVAAFIEGTAATAHTNGQPMFPPLFQYVLSPEIEVHNPTERDLTVEKTSAEYKVADGWKPFENIQQQSIFVGVKKAGVPVDYFEFIEGTTKFVLKPFEKRTLCIRSVERVDDQVAYAGFPLSSRVHHSLPDPMHVRVTFHSPGRERLSLEYQYVNPPVERHSKDSIQKVLGGSEQVMFFKSIDDPETLVTKYFVLSRGANDCWHVRLGADMSVGPSLSFCQDDWDTIALDVRNGDLVNSPLVSTPEIRPITAPSSPAPMQLELPQRYEKIQQCVRKRSLLNQSGIDVSALVDVSRSTPRVFGIEVVMQTPSGFVRESCRLSNKQGIIRSPVVSPCTSPRLGPANA